MDVSDVQVSHKDGYSSRSNTITANSKIVKERIWINPVTSKIVIQPLDTVDRTPTHNTHLCSTVCSQTRNAHHALGPSHTDCSVIFVCLKRICHLVLHMSHPCWLPHLPFTTSTSSSSFTLPSTTTPEYAARPVQHDPLREHPVHHAHLQATSVDKQRHQESLWCENPAEWRKPAHDNSRRCRH